MKKQYTTSITYQIKKQNYILDLLGLEVNDNKISNDYKKELLKEKEKKLKDIRFKKIYLKKYYSKDKNSKNFKILKTENNDYIDNIFKSNFVFRYNCNIFYDYIKNKNNINRNKFDIIKTNPDGNCFYYSLSEFLFGNSLYNKYKYIILNINSNIYLKL